MQWPIAVGSRGWVRCAPSRTRRAASSTVMSAGGVGEGALRRGTDTIVPWFVSVLAVATVSSA